MNRKRYAVVGASARSEMYSDAISEKPMTIFGAIYRRSQ